MKTTKANKNARINKGINANEASNPSKRAVKSGRLIAALKIDNGIDQKSRDCAVNNNVMMTNLQINAEVANCEVAQTDTSHFKMSISLPWGGEAKIEWNGSSTTSSSVLAKQECAKISKERRENADKEVKSFMEAIISCIPSAVNVMKEVMAEDPESEKSIEDKVKENYNYIDPSWRRSFERCISDRNSDLDPEENSFFKSQLQEDESWIKEQAELINLGILNEVQVHLLYKSGLVIDSGSESSDDFSTVK